MGKGKWLVGEQVQLNMGKKILRCTLHTSNEAIYGDLGWWSLEARRNYKKLVYWYHLETLENNRITKRVYLLSKNNNKSTGWADTIHKILSLYGLQRLYDNPRNLYNLDGKRNNEAKSITDHCKFWKRYLKKIVGYYEEKLWLGKMSHKKNGKLRNYVVFKKNLRLEKYLLGSSDYSLGRMYHTTLRNGTNILEIEKGRWKHIPLDQRYCNQCDCKLVESEKHFLLDCSKYATFRNHFFDSVMNISKGKWNFRTRNADEVLILLLQGTGDDYEMKIFNSFHKFLEKCFKIRTQNSQ